MGITEMILTICGVIAAVGAPPHISPKQSEQQ